MVSKLGKKLYFLMLLLIIGAFVVGGYEALAAPGDQTPVTFPDPNLETAIREALNKPEGAIYTSDLESLIELNAQSRGITDLTGLEYCINLIELNLGEHWIRDISPLAGLTNLQNLSLGQNQISDISPLAGLTNLRELYLWSNQIRDISPLAGLTNLQNLSLGQNQISDISPLAGLTNLQILNLWNNQINDISPLAGLTNLESLDLSHTQISDISPLGGLTNLRELYLWENQISNILPLAGLTNLQNLELRNNQISDLLPLVENSGLSAGDDVRLANNPLSTDSLEVYIPQLEQRGVQVSWLFIPKPVPPPTPTDEIVNFPDADLETAIRKALNKLEGAIYTSDLESLIELNAQRRGITDLTGLEYCINLIELNLKEHWISDISPLAGLTNLRGLYLWSNQISDISPLAGLTNLQKLVLDYNQISDISPLVENRGLSGGGKVGLSNNPLSTDSLNVYIPQLEQRGVQVWWRPTSEPVPILKPTPTGEIVNFPDADLENAIRKALNKPEGAIYTSDLESLIELDAQRRGITDLTGLEYCTSLTWLYLWSNLISDISPLAGLTNLQNLSLGQNQISDISPLAGLTNLRELYLWSNQISDISPLAGLTNLQSLSLHYNRISDISPLAGLPALNHVNLRDNPLSSASANIYIPLLAIKGVAVRPNFQPIILNTIIFIALALVAIWIGMTKRRMASWGWARRALQLSLITIVCGLAYYFACTGLLHYVAFPIIFLLVSLGAVVAFWSYRSRVSELVALGLIALALVSFVVAVALVNHFTVPYKNPFWLLVGPPSALILAATGVLFLLRRVRLRIAIIVSALVLLVSSGLALFLIALSGN